MLSSQLSVVLPNFNHAQYLPVSLPALASQSPSPAEILVIDDASTDDSVAVIERFAREFPTIRLERNERNRGVVFGMNRGLELARGDYVYFAAADDQALPGIFGHSLKLLRQYPQAALSCGICEWKETATGLDRHIGVRMGDRPCYLAPEQLVKLEKSGRLWISTHTALFKRSALIEAGGFIPELKWHCDWFASYVAAFRHGLCFVPEPLAIFNIVRTSFSLNQKRDPAAQRAVLRRMLELLNEPEYAEAAERIRTSGALFQFGKPLLRLMRAEPAFRRFLTPHFLRKNLLHNAKMDAKQFTPRWLARVYFRLAGFHYAEKTKRDREVPVPPRS